MTSFAPIPLLWEGAPFAYHSFGIVSREMGRALLRRPEVDLTFIPCEMDQFDPRVLPEYAPLVEACARNKMLKTPLHSPGKPVLVRLQFPLRALPPPRTHWVIYHPWEYTRSARASVEIMKRAKEIWTTSQFAREAFVRSGVLPEKIHIVPNGVNPEIFRPQGLCADLPTAKPFRFLFVGGTIYRKGIDILLEAYGRAFTSSDPVSLIIKDFGGNGIYHFERGGELTQSFSLKSSHPEVVHLPAHRSDPEMAALFRACDVFVSSYRGEGFCLPALEAMACGKPVIVTKGGSTDDFVPASAGWHIPAELRSAGSQVFGMPIDGEAQLFEPDVDALVELLRNAYRDESSRKDRGVAAAASAQNWTWDAAADRVIARCQKLAAEES